MRTREQAIEWANGHRGRFGWDNLCLSFVRQSFGIDYVGDWPTPSRNAGTAWDRAKVKHRTSDPMSIPRGVPVFFELQTAADHVVLSLGKGRCLSNDFVVQGRIDEVSIGDIANRWGPLLGWTEDLVGNRVYGSDTPPSKGLPVHGVDLSHWNTGVFDYDAAMLAGVRFVYHKATEGSTVRDSMYPRRRAQIGLVRHPRQTSKVKRMRFGAYHFARPSVGDAAKEAAHFLDVADPRPGDLLPMLDLEDTGNLTRAELTTWVGTFVRAVEKATGNKPIIYTPFDLNDDFGCMLWVARYNNANEPPRVPDPWKRWDVRQFSNGVYGVPSSVPGFGRVDLNMLRDGLSVSDLRLKPRVVEPKPEPEPEPLPEGRVLRGGSFNLEFGRDPEQVRYEVTALLAKHNLDFLCVQEAQDYRRELPKISGFTYVVSDDDAQGAAQSGILVRDNHKTTNVRHGFFGDGWITTTGSRHAPVVMPRATIDGWLRVASFHMPTPLRWDGDTIIGPSERVDDYLATAKKAQSFLGTVMPPKARVAVADWNETPATVGAWSPAWIAESVGAQLDAPGAREGHYKIDYPVWKGCVVTDIAKDLAIREGSDHEPVIFKVTEAK